MVEVNKTELAEKFEADDLNELTCFEIIAREESIVVEISAKKTANLEAQHDRPKSEAEIRE